MLLFDLLPECGTNLVTLCSVNLCERKPDTREVLRIDRSVDGPMDVNVSQNRCR